MKSVGDLTLDPTLGTRVPNFPRTISDRKKSGSENAMSDPFAGLQNSNGGWQCTLAQVKTSIFFPLIRWEGAP